MIYTQSQLLDIYAKIYSLNKTQLASDLGITRPTLNHYISGTRSMPLIFKKYIALDLSIPVQFLDFEFVLSDLVCPLTKQRLHDLPF